MARKVKKMSNKRYFDYSLLFVIIFIVGFGLVMIYSYQFLHGTDGIRQFGVLF